MSGFKWSASPETFVNAVVDNVDVQMSRAATQIFRELVTDSPVYSGALRACWRVSQGKPVVVSLPGRHAKGSIARPSLVQRRFKGMKDIYITNGQYYASFIEYGTATRGPQAFVERAIDRASR